MLIPRRPFSRTGRRPRSTASFATPLGKALRLIQAQGRDAFYKGDIAKAIVAKVKAGGGVDGAERPRRVESEWVEPITTNYHGYDVFSCRPRPGRRSDAEHREVCAPKLGIPALLSGPPTR